MASHRGYKALSGEALLALDPQVVVFADRTLEGEAARQSLLQQTPALAGTRAAREGRLLALDPTLLVGGLGPRVPDGLAML
ncbi:ABC transporter substrate-binding protein, partial [Escherichia coli]|uniref:ABC transporter substrate-binding protein n=1 Tax=Escherichia coli TaxID=562 RepID=UPI0034D9862F